MVRSQRSACLIEQHHGRDDEWALNWASRFTFCLFYCFGGVFFSAGRWRRMVFNCKSDDFWDIFVYPQSVLVHPEKKIMISTETQFCFVFNILETLFFRLRYSYYRFLFVLLLCFCEDLYSNCRQNCVYPFFDCSFTSHLFSLVFFTSLHLLYHHYFRFGFFFPKSLTVHSQLIASLCFLWQCLFTSY